RARMSSSASVASTPTSSWATATGTSPCSGPPWRRWVPRCTTASATSNAPASRSPSPTAITAACSTTSRPAAPSTTSSTATRTSPSIARKGGRASSTPGRCSARRPTPVACWTWTPVWPRRSSSSADRSRSLRVLPPLPRRLDLLRGHPVAPDDLGADVGQGGVELAVLERLRLRLAAAVGPLDRLAVLEVLRQVERLAGRQLDHLVGHHAPLL